MQLCEVYTNSSLSSILPTGHGTSQATSNPKQWASSTRETEAQETEEMLILQWLELNNVNYQLWNINVEMLLRKNGLWVP